MNQAGKGNRDARDDNQGSGRTPHYFNKCTYMSFREREETPECN